MVYDLGFSVVGVDRKTEQILRGIFILFHRDPSEIQPSFHSHQHISLHSIMHSRSIHLHIMQLCGKPISQYRERTGKLTHVLFTLPSSIPVSKPCIAGIRAVVASALVCLPFAACQTTDNFSTSRVQPQHEPCASYRARKHTLGLRETSSAVGRRETDARRSWRRVVLWSSASPSSSSSSRSRSHIRPQSWIITINLYA
jgi:hypothetical protein